MNEKWHSQKLERWWIVEYIENDRREAEWLRFAMGKGQSLEHLMISCKLAHGITPCYRIEN